MSFAKITDIDINKDSRSLVILYNFNNKEVSNIKTICKLFGIRDMEILSRKNSSSKISDIIEEKIEELDEEGINERSMVFNNVNPMKVSAVIDSLKKFRMNRPLVAFVTENNIDWTLDNLISHLLEERNALKQGKVVKH